VSQPRSPQPVKLVMSFLYAEEGALALALAEASQRFGKIDFLSEPMPFDFTDYYQTEMGAGLKRRIVAFETLISPDALVPVKRWTNAFEFSHLNEHQGRSVNIDPGYMAAAKFILATGKDYSHRIYLGEGIYGDLTLIFRPGGYSSLPWTYPDYASESLRNLLNLLRKRYLWQLKNEGEKGEMGKGEKG
jgi:hypothetical protein